MSSSVKFSSTASHLRSVNILDSMHSIQTQHQVETIISNCKTAHKRIASDQRTFQRKLHSFNQNYHKFKQRLLNNNNFMADNGKGGAEAVPDDLLYIKEARIKAGQYPHKSLQVQKIITELTQHREKQEKQQQLGEKTGRLKEIKLPLTYNQAELQQFKQDPEFFRVYKVPERQQPIEISRFKT